VADKTGQPGQVHGAAVILTAFQISQEATLDEALTEIMSAPVRVAETDLPLTTLETPSLERAEWAYDLLEAAGGTVQIERIWVDADEDNRDRPVCPKCGSAHTEPYTHAGPAARVNMRCTTCGHTFKRLLVQR